jgi:hypothetical protein
MARHKKSNYEKLHATDTVAQEIAKTANKFHKLLVEPGHRVRWGKGD